MFVVHPDTRLLHEVTFQVTSHEGSVIVSCATSLELSLIHPHTNLDELPEEGSLIYSKADMPKQKRNKNTQAEKYVHMQPKKPATDVQSERSAMLIHHNKIKKSNIKDKEEKFLYSDKNCQANKNDVMQSVTKEENTDVQLPKPARLCRDKNCQSTRCYTQMSPGRPIQSK